MQKCNYFQLVPTRVGMILGDKVKAGDKLACPHTRGDDPPVV